MTFKTTKWAPITRGNTLFIYIGILPFSKVRLTLIAVYRRNNRYIYINTLERCVYCVYHGSTNDVVGAAVRYDSASMLNASNYFYKHMNIIG
jgi:hypothetical protein